MYCACKLWINAVLPTSRANNQQKHVHTTRLGKVIETAPMSTHIQKEISYVQGHKKETHNVQNSIACSKRTPIVAQIRWNETKRVPNFKVWKQQQQHTQNAIKSNNNDQTQHTQQHFQSATTHTSIRKMRPNLNRSNWYHEPDSNPICALFGTKPKDALNSLSLSRIYTHTRLEHVSGKIGYQMAKPSSERVSVRCGAHI